MLAWGGVIRLACVFALLPGCLCGWPESSEERTPAPGTDGGPDGGLPCGFPDEADQDHDGFVSMTCGGDDCDDGDASIFPGAPAGSGNGWTLETVHPGSEHDILVDAAAVAGADGTLHVAYVFTDGGGGSTLFYATRGDSWSHVVVDDAESAHTTIQSPSLAIAADGLARVAWFDVEDDRESGQPNRSLPVAIGGLGGFDREEVVAHVVAENRTSLAVDDEGRTHLVYRDGGVRYAVGDAGGWTFEVLDPEGSHGSVAIRDGEALVAYWTRVGERELRVAHSSTGGWDRDVVGASNGGLPWIGVDGFGYAHVVFKDGTDIFHSSNRFGAWTAPAWVTSGTDPTAGVDLAGTVRIAYSEGGAIRLATGRGDDWTTEEVTRARGPSSLAVTPVGAVSIAFASQDCENEYYYRNCHDSLVVASRHAVGVGVDRNCDGFVEKPAPCPDEDGDGQSATTCGGIDCDDARDDVFFGADDSFGDGIDQDCDEHDGVDRDGDGYATSASGGEDCDDRRADVHPDAPDVDDCVDFNCDGTDGVDLDGDGYVQPACGGDDCDDADVSSFPGALDVVGDGIDQDCDEADGVDSDGDGFASVATGGDDCDDAMDTVHPGAADGARVWRNVPIETSGNPVTASLAIDDSGVLHATWLKASTTEVRYGQRDGAAWTRETVDDVGDSGPDPSIAIGPDGFAQITYRESAADELRWATNASGAWVHEAVDGSGTPQHSAIAVAPDGTIHVAYVDAWDRDTLEHATRSGGVWPIETVDSDGATGHGAAITLDAAGAVHVVYAELGDEVLRHATNASGAWTVETVDPGPSQFEYLSLTLGPDGSLHASYRVGGVGVDAGADVWYATNASGSWEIEVADDSLDSGYGTGIQVDAAGVVRIAEVQDRDLTLLTNSSGAWESETIDEGTYIDAHLVLDPSGNAHVVSLDTDSGDLLEWTDEVLPDGVDQNCDGVDGVDADGDGHASKASGGDDCDDADAAVQTCG